MKLEDLNFKLLKLTSVDLYNNSLLMKQNSEINFKLVKYNDAIKLSILARKISGQGNISIYSVDYQDNIHYIDKISIQSSSPFIYNVKISNTEYIKSIALKRENDTGIVYIDKISIYDDIQNTYDNHDYCIIIPYKFIGGAEVYIKTYLENSKYKNLFTIFIHKEFNDKLFFSNFKTLEFKDNIELLKLLNANKFKKIIYYNSLAIYNLLKKIKFKTDIYEIYHSNFIWPDAIAQINVREIKETLIRVSNELVNNISCDKKYLPVSIDVKRFSNIKSEPIFEHWKGKKIIGTVARISDEKNIKYILELAKISPENYQFVIVGDGPQRKSLSEIANKESLNIFFANHQDNIPHWLSMFDVFILPSKMEGTPISIIEAMASGIPILTTRVGQINDIIENEKYGKYLTMFPEKDLEILNDLLKSNKRIIYDKVFEFDIQKNKIIFDEIISSENNKNSNILPGVIF